ncbi:MAG: hypothetical protein N2663_05740 [Chlorobi bacterium]|nr:hypothetical protein [Chlorobiota bacterium]
MRFGFRRPSLRKRIAARTSWKRYVRHSMGLKVPRGWSWLTNPRRTVYNRIYTRTTRPTCVIVLLIVTMLLAVAFIGAWTLVGVATATSAKGELKAVATKQRYVPASE